MVIGKFWNIQIIGHDIACPWVEDGGYGLQIWRVAVDIPSMQSWTASKGQFSSLGVGQGTNNSSL